MGQSEVSFKLLNVQVVGPFVSVKNCLIIAPYNPQVLSGSDSDKIKAIYFPKAVIIKIRATSVSLLSRGEICIIVIFSFSNY